MKTRNEKLREHVHNILEEMYEEATPGMDYQEALKEGERSDRIPRYRLHYLSSEDCKRIMDKYINEHDSISAYDENIIRTNVNLGAAPTENLERVIEKREEAGLDTEQLEKLQ